MLDFFRKQPPQTTGQAPPQSGSPAKQTRPTGPFSPGHIRLLVFCAIGAAVLFMVLTSQTPKKKPSQQQEEATQTTDAAKKAGASIASRDYHNEVNDALRPTTQAVNQSRVPLPASQGPGNPQSNGPQNQQPAAASPSTSQYTAQPTSGAPKLYYEAPSTYPSSVPSARGGVDAAPRDPVGDQHEAILAEEDKREHDSLRAGLIVASDRTPRDAHTAMTAPSARAHRSNKQPRPLYPPAINDLSPQRLPPVPATTFPVRKDAPVSLIKTP